MTQEQADELLKQLRLITECLQKLANPPMVVSSEVLSRMCQDIRPGSMKVVERI